MDRHACSGLSPQVAEDPLRPRASSPPTMPGALPITRYATLSPVVVFLFPLSPSPYRSLPDARRIGAQDLVRSFKLNRYPTPGSGGLWWAPRPYPSSVRHALRPSEPILFTAHQPRPHATQHAADDPQGRLSDRRVLGHLLSRRDRDHHAARPEQPLHPPDGDRLGRRSSVADEGAPHAYRTWKGLAGIALLAVALAGMWRAFRAADAPPEEKDATAAA